MRLICQITFLWTLANCQAPAYVPPVGFSEPNVAPTEPSGYDVASKNPSGDVGPQKPPPPIERKQVPASAVPQKQNLAPVSPILSLTQAPPPYSLDDPYAVEVLPYDSLPAPSPPPSVGPLPSTNASNEQPNEQQVAPSKVVAEQPNAPPTNTNRTEPAISQNRLAQQPSIALYAPPSEVPSSELIDRGPDAPNPNGYTDNGTSQLGIANPPAILPPSEELASRAQPTPVASYGSLVKETNATISKLAEPSGSASLIPASSVVPAPPQVSSETDTEEVEVAAAKPTVEEPIAEKKNSYTKNSPAAPVPPPSLNPSDIQPSLALPPQSPSTGSVVEQPKTAGVSDYGETPTSGQPTLTPPDEETPNSAQPVKFASSGSLGGAPNAPNKNSHTENLATPAAALQPSQFESLPAKLPSGVETDEVQVPPSKPTNEVPSGPSGPSYSVSTELPAAALPSVTQSASGSVVESPNVPTNDTYTENTTVFSAPTPPSGIPPEAETAEVQVPPSERIVELPNAPSNKTNQEPPVALAVHPPAIPYSTRVRGNPEGIPPPQEYKEVPDSLASKQETYQETVPPYQERNANAAYNSPSVGYSTPTPTYPTPEYPISDIGVEAASVITERKRVACPSDILFVIDSTASVREKWQKHKEFIARVANGLVVGPEDDRVAAIVYSSKMKQKTKISFSDHPEKETLLSAIRALPFFSGITATGAALKFAMQELSNRRTNLTTNVVVLTDGYSYDPIDEPSAIIQGMKNVRMFGVTVQDPYNQKELLTIAGDEERVLHGVESGDDLIALIRSCAEGQTPKPPGSKTTVVPGVNNNELGDRRAAARSRDQAEKNKAKQTTLSPEDYESGEEPFPEGSMGEKQVHQEEVNPASGDENGNEEGSHSGELVGNEADDQLEDLPLPLEEISGEIEVPGWGKERGYAEEDSLSASGSAKKVVPKKQGGANETAGTKGGSSKKPAGTDESVNKTVAAKKKGFEGCAYDIVVILDSSGSLSHRFNEELNITANLIDKLILGPKNAQVSVIKYAGPKKVRVLFGFNHFQEKKKMMGKVKGTQFISGITRTNDAIMKANDQFKGKSARPGKAKPIAIIFTDGFSQDDVSQGAKMMREQGVTVFTIAVTKGFPINRKELEMIAGSKGRVYTDETIEKFESDFHRFTADCVMKSN